MIKPFRWMILVLTLLFLFETTGSTQNKTRSKSIDFDGDVVEGMNKKPLDSLNQITESDRKKKKPHLYHKKSNFRSENSRKLREMRYVP